MGAKIDTSKRALIQAGGTGLLVAGGLTLLSVPALALDRKARAQARGAKPEKDEKVTPPEDLMREHGVLDRVLLVYEEGMRRFSANQDFDPAVLTNAGELTRDFINNYHEKSEENSVFPRFKKAGQMVGLVDTLLAQHQAGRRLTEIIIQTAPQSRKGGDERRQLVSAMQQFITMYRPHAAREDTELFPKLQKLVSAHEYDAMAEDFEKQEHQLFGEDGFEKIVARVAALEKGLGINDLSKFTPH